MPFRGLNGDYLEPAGASIVKELKNCCCYQAANVILNMLAEFDARVKNKNMACPGRGLTRKTAREILRAAGESAALQDDAPH